MMTNEENYIEDDTYTSAKIKVIGVGGGGSNAVNRMLLNNLSDGIEYWVMNTDSQALSYSKCRNKLVLGRSLTKGLGAGGDPKRGKDAAEASYSEIKKIVSGADLVFVACGEGGGTGTGASPVIARAAKEVGALVLGVVTRPFKFEGKPRSINANNGINELKNEVDSLIMISNDMLIMNNGQLPINDAFANSDNILANTVKTVTDIILKQGYINLDFADVRTTLSAKGYAMIGFGSGRGDNRGIDAAKDAIDCPLLESNIKGARSMLINVTSGKLTTLNDVNYAIEYITEIATNNKEGDDKTSIIFGVQNDDSLEDDEMRISIIATNFTNDGISPTNNYESIAEKRLSETEKELERNKQMDIQPSYLKKR